MEGLLFKYYKQNECDSNGDFFKEGRCYIGYGFNQKAFTEMAFGYKDAAECLIERFNAIRYDPGSPDNLVYPALFCYRQAVELLLKAILLNLKIPFCRSSTDAEKDSIKWSHNLNSLFLQIKEGILESDKLGMDEIKPYLDEFDKVDHGSDSMRYPGGKDLKSSTLHRGLTAIDINYTKEQFPRLWDLLFALYSKTEKSWSAGKYVV